MATKQVWSFGASGASVSVPEDEWGRFASGEPMQVSEGGLEAPGPRQPPAPRWAALPGAAGQACITQNP